MKVDLEKIIIAHSPLTDRIFAGTSLKPGVWRNKVDITNFFIGCVIDRWAGHQEVIEDGKGNAYKISVVKLSKEQRNPIHKKAIKNKP